MLSAIRVLILHLIRLNNLHNFIKSFAWRNPLKPAQKRRHLPILPNLLPPQDIIQVPIQLQLAVVLRADLTLHPLLLPDPPVQNLEHPLPVEIDRVHHVDYVVDQLLLYQVVQNVVPRERGAAVDLQQVALQVVVDYDVVPEQLEAIRVARDVLLAGDQTLEDDLLHLHPDLRPIYPALLQLRAQLPQADFAPAKGVLVALVRVRLQVVLLHGVVRQVDEDVVQVVRVQVVELRGYPREALLVEEGLQRVHRRDQHVDPHVELVPLQQQRVFEVLLHDHGLRVDDLGNVVYHGDAPAPGLPDRLHDPDVQVAFELEVVVEALGELAVLLREEEGGRDYVEELLGFLAQLLHPLDVLLQEVLAAQVFVEGEVVNFLEEQELVHVDLGLGPGPEEVPGGFQVDSVGKLVPVLFPHEGAGDDVVDLLFGFYHAEVHRLPRLLLCHVLRGGEPLVVDDLALDELLDVDVGFRREGQHLFRVVEVVHFARADVDLRENVLLLREQRVYAVHSFHVLRK